MIMTLAVEWGIIRLRLLKFIAPNCTFHNVQRLRYTLLATQPGL